jgi:hypothetical protein
MIQTKNNKNSKVLGSFAALSLLASLSLTACQSTAEKTDSSNTSTPATEETKSSEENKAADSSIDGWTKYNAYDGSYSVSFPNKPTEKKDYLDTQIGKVFFSEASYTEGKSFYSTSHTTYPVAPKDYDAEKGLDGSRDGISKAVNMQIVSEKKIQINGFPAREIEMKGKDGALLAHLILDPNGPTLYQVFVVTGDGNVNTPENQAFLKSFAIARK